MKNTFDEFLRDWHMRDYQGTDDDAPDAYDNWSAELDIDTLCSIANIYGKEQYIRGMKEVKDLVFPPTTI
jgi:hypothetical protein